LLREGTMSRSPWHHVRALASVAAAALALSVVGCGGSYVDLQGGRAYYVNPPSGIEAFPRYAYGGAYVYDVNGRFYRQYNGRWVSYSHAPPEVQQWHDYQRGRAEPQPPPPRGW
jgi:hypothetical protein